MQKMPLKHKNKMKLPRGRNGVTLMELVVAMALFAIISTFAVTMALSVNTKTNNGIGTVGAANEMKRAERLIENWFYSSGSGNNMCCVNVIGGTPDSTVTTAPATTAATTTAATTAPTETNPTAATTIKSEILLDWSIVSAEGDKLKISNTQQGCIKGTGLNTSNDGWVSYTSTSAKNKNNFYFWGFPSGYSSHKGFRFKAYASKNGAVLYYGDQNDGNKQKHVTLYDSPSNYYYIETSYLNGTGGNITFYPEESGVTIYISDIEWYDEVEVSTTPAATTAATTTAATTEMPAEPPHSPININIQNGVIVIMNSGSSNESYLVFDKDNMTVSCGDQYESEKLFLKKSQGLEISTNGTLLKLVFNTPDFPFNKRVMLFAKRTTD